MEWNIIIMKSKVLPDKCKFIEVWQPKAGLNIQLILSRISTDKMKLK